MLRYILENVYKFNIDLHLSFSDFKQAYDSKMEYIYMKF